jgi:hypothetical protein
MIRPPRSSPSLFPRLNQAAAPTGGSAHIRTRTMNLIPFSQAEVRRLIQLASRYHRDYLAEPEQRVIPEWGDYANLLRFVNCTSMHPLNCVLLTHGCVHLDLLERRLLIDVPRPGVDDGFAVSTLAGPRLLAEMRSRGWERPDYLFFPQLENREEAVAVIEVLFGVLVGDARLRRDERGRERTLGSLVGTSLAHRLVQDIQEPIFLAMSAGIELEELERFAADELGLDIVNIGIRES